MNTRLFEFMELFEKSLIDDKFNHTFTIAYDNKYKEPNVFFMNKFYSSPLYTLTLDKEDLNYLYNKYYSKYKKEVIKRDEELKVQKDKEIKLLEDKLNKLKNE